MPAVVHLDGGEGGGVMIPLPDLREVLGSIRQGTELLDKRVQDWRDHIDFATLDLEDCTECIVAQATGEGYFDALTTLFGDTADSTAIAHGFMLPRLGGEGYPNFTELWIAELIRQDGGWQHGRRSMRG